MRAKFVCESVTVYAGGADAPHTVKLRPVTRGDGVDSKENRRFWTATPGGSIELHGLCVDAAQQFNPGSFYHADFTLADDSVVDQDYSNEG